MKPEYTICDSNVRLRSIVVDDIEMLRCWRNQDSIRNSFVYSGIISQEQQAKWFIRYLSDNCDFMFIALYKDEPIGACALYNVDPQNLCCEFGRLMIGNTQLRGMGLGKRLTKLATLLGFEMLGLERVYLEVFQENTYAKNVYKSLGYRITGTAMRNNREVWLMEVMKENWSQ